ncbi:MAG: hypothetical protein M3P93_03830 [Actinomycetota bacterium]|nr:hypothetical protein [Actinomycetota bacterium]
MHDLDGEVLRGQPRGYGGGERRLVLDDEDQRGLRHGASVGAAVWRARGRDVEIV